MTLRVLGLDFGLVTGYSLNTGGKPIDYGVLRIGNPEIKQPCWRLGARSELLESKLLDVVDRLRPDLLAFEQVMMSFKTSAAAEGYLIGYVTANRVAYILGLPIIGIFASSVKKHATGNGKASKTDMIRNVQTRWRIELTAAQDDVADAMWVADKGELEWTTANRPTSSRS